MREDIYERITYFSEKLFRGQSLSISEAAELEEFLSLDPRIREAFESRTDPAVLEELTRIYLRANSIWKDKYDEIRSSRKTITFNRWKLYTVSAAVIVCVVSGLILFIPRFKKGDISQKAQIADVQPGGNKAILTLSDGATIILDSAKNGQLATQGRSRIIKLNNGQIRYSASGMKPFVGYNTISTPRGGTYQINLPDGSKAWLNAESSIQFPTSFNDNHRDVSITGEVYFEIARDPQKPFKVSSQFFNVMVLGTNFDIRSYKGEIMRATLTSGAVQVYHGGKQINLIPGDQVIVSSDLILTHGADVEQATAWKDNLFLFTHASIEEVMNEFSRWYNVQVKYEGERTDKKISGVFRRDVVASKNLAILKASGYNFRIEEGVIILLPN